MARLPLYIPHPLFYLACSLLPFPFPSQPCASSPSNICFFVFGALELDSSLAPPLFPPPLPSPPLPGPPFLQRIAPGTGGRGAVQQQNRPKTAAGGPAAAAPRAGPLFSRRASAAPRPRAYSASRHTQLRTTPQITPVYTRKHADHAHTILHARTQRIARVRPETPLPFLPDRIPHTTTTTNAFLDPFAARAVRRAHAFCVVLARGARARGGGHNRPTPNAPPPPPSKAALPPPRAAPMCPDRFFLETPAFPPSTIPPPVCLHAARACAPPRRRAENPSPSPLLYLFIRTLFCFVAAPAPAPS